MRRILIIIIPLLFAPGLSAQSKVDSGFSENEVILNTATGQIHGTLMIPASSKKIPLVIIIAGSGPTDRNGNSPLGVQANTYKMLAENLAGNSIASLRFDKRGIAKSKPAMKSESELLFETYINDVSAWISLLKTDKRFSSLIILGHSEGSLIGMAAAQQSGIDGFISISGTGKPAEMLLKEQLEKQLPPQLMDESNKILDSLKNGKTVTKVNPSLTALYRPGVQPYMISWFRYDPAEEIGKLKMPVLIIQGTTDIQVTVNDAKLLSAAKPDAKLMIVENMNHVLKECDSDVGKNMSTYKNPNLPLKPGLTEEIVDFIKNIK